MSAAGDLERWLEQRGLGSALSHVRSGGATPSNSTPSHFNSASAGGGVSSGNGQNSGRLSSNEKQRIASLLGRYGSTGSSVMNTGAGALPSTSVFNGLTPTNNAMPTSAYNTSGGDDFTNHLSSLTGSTPIAYELTTQNGYSTNARNQITHSTALMNGGAGPGGNFNAMATIASGYGSRAGDDIGGGLSGGGDTESVHSFASNATGVRSVASRAAPSVRSNAQSSVQPAYGVKANNRNRPTIVNGPGSSSVKPKAGAKTKLPHAAGSKKPSPTNTAGNSRPTTGAARAQQQQPAPALKGASSMPVLRPAGGGGNKSSQSTVGVISPYLQRIGSANVAASTAGTVKPSKLPAAAKGKPGAVPTSAAAAAAASAAANQTPELYANNFMHSSGGGGLGTSQSLPAFGRGSSYSSLYPSNSMFGGPAANASSGAGVAYLNALNATAGSDFKMGNDPLREILAKFESIDRNNRNYQPPALGAVPGLPPAHHSPDKVRSLHHYGSAGSNAGPNTGANGHLAPLHPAPNTTLSPIDGSPAGSVLEKYRYMFPSSAMHHPLLQTVGTSTGAAATPGASPNAHPPAFPFDTSTADRNGAASSRPGSSVGASRMRPAAVAVTPGSRRGSIEAILNAERERELTTEQRLREHEQQLAAERQNADRERASASTQAHIASAAANLATAAASAAIGVGSGGSSPSGNATPRSRSHNRDPYASQPDSRRGSVSQTESTIRDAATSAAIAAAVRGTIAPTSASSALPAIMKASPTRPVATPTAGGAGTLSIPPPAVAGSGGAGAAGTAQSLFPSRALVESLLTLDLVSDNKDSAVATANANADGSAAAPLATKYAVAEHLRNALGDHTLAFLPSSSALNATTYIASYQPSSVLPMALPTLSPELLNASVLPLLSSSSASASTSASAAANASLSTSLSALSVDLLSLHLTPALPPFTPIQTETYTYTVSTDRDHIQTLIEDRRPAPTPSARSTTLLKQFTSTERSGADQSALEAARSVMGPHVSGMPNTALGMTALSPTAAASTAAPLQLESKTRIAPSPAAVAADPFFDEKAAMAAFPMPGTGLSSGLVLGSTPAPAAPIVSKPIQPTLYNTATNEFFGATTIAMPAQPPTLMSQSSQLSQSQPPAAIAQPMQAPSTAFSALAALNNVATLSSTTPTPMPVQTPAPPATAPAATASVLSPSHAQAQSQLPPFHTPVRSTPPALAMQHSSSTSPPIMTTTGPQVPPSTAASSLNPMMSSPLTATAGAAMMSTPPPAGMMDQLVVKFRAGTITPIEQQYLMTLLTHQQQQQQIQALLSNMQQPQVMPMVMPQPVVAPAPNTGADVVAQLQAFLAAHTNTNAAQPNGGGKHLVHSQSTRSLASSAGGGDRDDARSEVGDVMGSSGVFKPHMNGHNTHNGGSTSTGTGTGTGLSTSLSHTSTSGKPHKLGRTSTTTGNAQAALAREDTSSRNTPPPVGSKMAVDYKRMPKGASAIDVLKAATTGGAGGHTLAPATGGIPEGRPSVRDSDDEKENALITPAQRKDLFTKCRNNRYHQVEELFASGVSVATTDKHGNTCLHIACQNGNKRMVKVCLRWGADINAANRQGQTPLHYSFAYNYQEVSVYLIGKGGDDSVLNHFGMSCYDGLRPETKDEAIAALRKHLGEQAVTQDVIAQHLGELSTRSNASH